MNWNKPRHLSLLLAVALVAGCATAPDRDRRESRGESAISPEFRNQFQQAVALMDEDPSRARQALQRLHQAQPDLTGPLLNLCILDFRDDNTDAARACFEQVLERNAEQPDALNHLGVMARKAGEFGQAEDYYRRALTADPDHLPSLRNLGILLDLYQGQHREALRLYEQYQTLLPEPDPMVSQWVADLKNRL
ncbi:tetratricopeptide repeat protein [Marinobacter lacisalsi]|uniref:Tetratricopeptide repeat protein n=1 Tax=Marinobacter lacisalsi TaxID=475979 RepID=A0ABV8QDF5_9GAMM